jgi:hypothetical protein
LSSSNSQVNYTVTIDLEGGGAQATANFTIPQDLGVTDDNVLAFITHLRAFTWPTGVYSSFTVAKSEQTTVSYSTDMAATPPAFT